MTVFNNDLTKSLQIQHSAVRNWWELALSQQCSPNRRKKKRLKEGRGGDVLEEDHTHPHLQVRTERIKLLAIPFSFQVLQCH